MRNGDRESKPWAKISNRSLELFHSTKHKYLANQIFMAMAPTLKIKYKLLTTNGINLLNRQIGELLCYSGFFP